MWRRNPIAQSLCQAQSHVRFERCGCAPCVPQSLARRGFAVRCREPIGASAADGASRRRGCARVTCYVTCYAACSHDAGASLCVMHAMRAAGTASVCRGTRFPCRRPTHAREYRPARDTTVTEPTAPASSQSRRADARGRAAPSIKSLFRSLGVTARYVTRNAKPARNTRLATRGRFMRAFDRPPAKPCQTGVCDARLRLWRVRCARRFALAHRLRNAWQTRHAAHAAAKHRDPDAHVNLVAKRLITTKGTRSCVNNNVLQGRW